MFDGGLHGEVWIVTADPVLLHVLRTYDVLVAAGMEPAQDIDLALIDQGVAAAREGTERDPLAWLRRPLTPAEEAAADAAWLRQPAATRAAMREWLLAADLLYGPRPPQRSGVLAGHLEGLRLPPDDRIVTLLPRYLDDLAPWLGLPAPVPDASWRPSCAWIRARCEEIAAILRRSGVAARTDARGAIWNAWRECVLAACKVSDTEMLHVRLQNAWAHLVLLRAIETRSLVDHYPWGSSLHLDDPPQQEVVVACSAGELRALRHATQRLAASLAAAQRAGAAVDRDVGRSQRSDAMQRAGGELDDLRARLDVLAALVARAHAQKDPVLRFPDGDPLFARLRRWSVHGLYADLPSPSPSIPNSSGCGTARRRSAGGSAARVRSCGASRGTEPTPCRCTSTACASPSRPTGSAAAGRGATRGATAGAQRRVGHHPPRIPDSRPRRPCRSST